jgi:hypothetical protein
LKDNRRLLRDHVDRATSPHHTSELAKDLRDVRLLRANKSSSENLPQECHMLLPVKRSPQFGHFQSGF